MGGTRVQELLSAISERTRDEFSVGKRILTFEEYLELFASEPKRYSRDAGHYIRDAFDFFGEREVVRPWGKLKRFKLFDLPWLDHQEARRDQLIGQERVQGELYRILENFTREGKVNKLPILHGPNGSAKSTVARCIMLALEHYSSLSEGALYRFQWVFPTRRSVRGAIGFGDKKTQVSSGESYAHLADEEIEARLLDEMRDHPLLLLPKLERRALMEDVIGKGPAATVNQWLWHGDLSHKNRTVFDALLASYDGSLSEVLRHVQVERYFVSRRYRVGAVSVGPELSVDARERQVTADRSISALPSSLQAVSLFEVHGELAEASGGVLEFSDLLKRPLDAFKYLQGTVETGEVSLASQNLQVNCVMLASTNEVELAAFRKHHEFETFRGRIELIPAPYLRNWQDEQQIYESQIAPQLKTHIVPHALRIAAMFAVLTRLRKPDADKYPRNLRDGMRSLKAFEKLELYGTGDPPTRLDADKAKLLRAAISQLYAEGESAGSYEGSLGASPREMRTVLLDAAQSSGYFGLSPFAVLEEVEKLCRRESEYNWLQQAAAEGGYHDHAEFRVTLREKLLDLVEDELRVASGLVEEKSYATLFERYLEHVSHWIKKEKMRNTVTGGYDEPDEKMMRDVEAMLNLPDEVGTLRGSWLNRVAAWAIEHPGEPVDRQVVFASYIRRLRDSVFAERRGQLADLARNLVLRVREPEALTDAKDNAEADKALARLIAEFGYERTSAADSVAVLVKERY